MSIDLIKEKGFMLKKTRNRRYPTETIKDADDLVLFTNTTIQAKLLLYSLEQAVKGIGFYVKTVNVF